MIYSERSCAAAPIKWIAWAENPNQQERCWFDFDPVLWVQQDSNLRPTGYEPVALTAELWTQERLTGFEPVTYSLEGYRSTTELQPH